MAFRRRRGERWSRFAARVANAFGLVLVLVIATYVLVSLTAYKGWTGVLIAAVSGASATVALASADARPALTGPTTTAAVTAVVLVAVSALTGGSTVLGVSALLLVSVLLVATGTMLGAVLREREVGFRTILGAVSVYINLGLLFTFLYAALDRLQDGPFFGVPAETGDFVFFSVTTLTTTGYGDLVPGGQPGRLFSGLEMLIGQLFLVTFIAGLVSLWRPGAALGRSR
jgi:Ion channel